MNYVSKQAPVPATDDIFNDGTYIKLILLVIVTILVVFGLTDHKRGQTIIIQLKKTDQVKVINVGSQFDVVVVSSTNEILSFRFGPKSGTLRFSQDQLVIEGNCANFIESRTNRQLFKNSTNFLLGSRRLDQAFGCKWYGSISAISWRVTIFKFPAARLFQSNWTQQTVNRGLQGLDVVVVEVS